MTEGMLILIVCVATVVICAFGCICVALKMKSNDRAQTYKQPELKSYSYANWKTENAKLDESTKTFDLTCSICLEDFIAKSVVKGTPCRHLYHKACLDLWTINKEKPECPNCKQFI